MKIKLFSKKKYNHILNAFGEVYLLHLWIFIIIIHPMKIARHSILSKEIEKDEML